MFGTKLRIRQWWSNIKLRKNKDTTANQVRDNSVASLVTWSFLKIAVLVFFAAIVLFPFFYMLTISVMPKEQAEELQSHFSFWPKSWEWQNYIEASHGSKDSKGYWYAFWLTFANVIFSIVLKIFVTMLCGYAFSLKKWRGKEFMWGFFISLLVLPEVALLFGQYKVVISLDNQFGVLKSFMGAIAMIALPFVASIFNALMFRNAFEAIPGRIKEVAMVDGAVGARYLFKIAMPMVQPTTLTIVILTTLASWNSYLWPALLFTGSNYEIMSVWLFQVGRENIDNVTRIHQNVKMAGAVLVILPMFVFYFIFRKKIMSSISRQGSAIKG
ncbi:carbohydrate ABC transporter permease [Mycoplasmopsis bovis]|uniref:ABC transporter permease n=4 Tax=Mycoplasmopsis bovis TaxID=28903 RepID=A0A059Y8Z6_MYCBV|nr:carbohydrate ABC transporter permease [Mycoplasmopsis bovis]ADR24801.1 oligosaccharide ABC transporter, permease protein [Mycoplasmopsis bovis PG45]AEI90259.1 ABC transporter permease protein [Mycoplasmopsis bovis Hubei-1]AFM51937.2 multiple sugar ABC transporter permease protein [Mycoplasmopsis bovis HB0801]AIA34122.1 ABC transporter permease [Mycoplasmopsis bovis CQ-W70]AKO50739.1 ABC transporter permease [Mycoplasmopsis bovis]